MGRRSRQKRERRHRVVTPQSTDEVLQDWQVESAVLARGDSDDLERLLPDKAPAPSDDAMPPENDEDDTEPLHHAV
jgi:hypothetical protein